MSVSWQQSAFKHYQSDKHFSETLPRRWRQKSSGIDMEENYVTVTLCISHERRFLIGCRPVQVGSRAVNRPLDRACMAAPCWDPLNHELHCTYDTVTNAAYTRRPDRYHDIVGDPYNHVRISAAPTTDWLHGFPGLFSDWWILGIVAGKKVNYQARRNVFVSGGVQICTNLIQSCS